jgi:hypothetical protein
MRAEGADVEGGPAPGAFDGDLRTATEVLFLFHEKIVSRAEGC